MSGRSEGVSERARIALIAAVARNGVIGADGGLAWRISDDLFWFKKSTMGKPIVMGRKTYESIGKALPGRDNIVVTRQADFDAPGIIVAATIAAALASAQDCAAASGATEICVIGGGEIYAQTIALADRVYLTEVGADIDGDTQFPAFDRQDWIVRRVAACQKNARNDYDCEFFILDRKPAER